MIKYILKITAALGASFVIVMLVAVDKKELTPKRLLANIASIIVRTPVVGKTLPKPKPVSAVETVNVSPENREKRLLQYNGQTFTVYVNKDAELTQETIKNLYDYWRLSQSINGN